MKILVMNGPNLNMLGVREPEIYGTMTVNDINAFLEERFPEAEFEFYQSNHEGDLVDKLQSTQADGVILNAGAYTHTSLAIHDAIAARRALPVVEVHLSDPSKREAFRHFSYLESVAAATFKGEREISYYKAAEYLLRHQKND